MTMAVVIGMNVQVKCNARLHMGFFDLHGGLGRKFGSIGLSLNEPCIELTASTLFNKSNQKIYVEADASISLHTIKKASFLANQLTEKLKLEGSINLNINKMIPEHTGLGSGTQLALSIGTAIKSIYKLNFNTTQLAEMTGRGGRSGIGIAAFDLGGLLIDGGRASGLGSTSKIPPLLARYDFPENWRILLIFDNNQQGIHGEVEREAFNKLPVFSENLAAHLCRHVLMQAMPALVENDLSAFGKSIQELQSHVGDYFAPAQGGRYASLEVASVLNYLKLNGVDCFGQSSWGPTGFAVFENNSDAELCLAKLKLVFKTSTLSWLICKACNRGALY